MIFTSIERESHFGITCNVSHKFLCMQPEVHFMIFGDFLTYSTINSVVKPQYLHVCCNVILLNAKKKVKYLPVVSFTATGAFY